MTLRLHYLQHVSFEGLGQIRSWAEANGAEITATRFYQDQQLPRLDSFDLLVIMGGAHEHRGNGSLSLAGA